MPRPPPGTSNTRRAIPASCPVVPAQPAPARPGCHPARRCGSIGRTRGRECMFKSDLFAGQRVLVTGGGTGLGRMMAERLLELGAAVEIWGRRPSVVEETAAAMDEAHPGMARWQAVDIKDPDAVERAVASAWDAGAPYTHLVNNAAGNFVSRTEDLSHRAFRAIADIVFHGSFQVTHAVGRRWIAEKKGGHAVVSIVVTWVRTGSPFVVPSAMSKAGVDAMTKSLAVE